jgi:outer membrane protein
MHKQSYLSGVRPTISGASWLPLLAVLLLVTFIAILFSRPQSAQAPPARIAVLDVNKVLSSSTQGKASYDRLKKMQDDRLAKAKQMNDEFTALDNELNTKKLSLSEDRLAVMAKQLSDKKIAMQRYAQDADREIGEARDREMQMLNSRLMPVVDAMSKEMGLAAVFNKFESGLIYASDAIDITDQVIVRSNGNVPRP